MGRLTSKEASGKTLLSLAYDLNGNLTRQEDVTGKVTEYQYDQRDQVREVWDNGKQVASYTYYPDGRVKSLKNGESLYTEYGYDRDKNLITQRTVLGEEVLVDNHYRYDGNGNRTQKQQLQGTIHYAYDALKRLKRVEYPTFTEELFYDKAGNRVRRVVEEAAGNPSGVSTAAVEETYFYGCRTVYVVLNYTSIIAIEKFRYFLCPTGVKIVAPYQKKGKMKNYNFIIWGRQKYLDLLE